MAMPLRHPDKFLKLCQAILNMHTALGPSSPFAAGDVVNMTQFANQLSRATAKRNEALEYYKKAESAMDESRSLIGNNTGQSSLSEGTCFYSVLRAKKLLLILNSENPEALSPWGFDVVVRTARRPGRKAKPQQP